MELFASCGLSFCSALLNLSIRRLITWSGQLGRGQGQAEVGARGPPGQAGRDTDGPEGKQGLVHLPGLPGRGFGRRGDPNQPAEEEPEFSNWNVGCYETWMKDHARHATTFYNVPLSSVKSTTIV